MLKGKVLRKIEEGRVLMGLDMIVRTATGEPANVNNTSLLQLYRMHQELAMAGTDAALKPGGSVMRLRGPSMAPSMAMSMAEAGLDSPSPSPSHTLSLGNSAHANPRMERVVVLLQKG
eukprot:TRINITY_DN34395_c0_g1_i1.p3 TRINITY_DN34395_c0_g1~~TRINITY_DN34395_c0_g1_i1.p3  ORF type:complete len:118 (-),score=32.72 TRINITY_DN34395_c0_g1_i1:86-439(-)